MTAESSRQPIPGVVIGVVTNRDDLDGLGRVEVTFPWMDDTVKSAWAPIGAAMSGGGRGCFFMPELDDEVLVAFEHGQFEHPFIVGFLWNGKDRPPSEDVRERMIRSVNGHTIRFLDSTPSAGNLGGIVIEDAHGNRIVMTQAKIAISATAVLELEAPVVVIKGPGYRRVVRQQTLPV
jgi:uncharacterized protein involved in type VI secretion and phage assembly